MSIKNIDNLNDEKMFDYTKLISEENNEGIWIVISISLFMIAILIWLVFF